jgi:hypothetical protein
MKFDQPRSVYFGRLNIRLDIVLRPDRLELKLVRSAEQLALPFTTRHGSQVNGDFGLTRRCDSLGAPNHLGDAAWAGVAWRRPRCKRTQGWPLAD